MNRLLYDAYNLVSAGLFVSGLAPFWLYTRLSGRFRAHLKERLGLVPPEIGNALSGRPRVWLHAASLGEVRAAAAVVEALRGILPGCAIVLSTTTEHGRELAAKILGEEIPVIYGPVDFAGSVRKSLSRIRPDVLAFVETEIWPAWLSEARRMRVKIALVNGRISVRSFGAYRRLRPFFRQVLRNVDVFSMISQEDADRVRELGAPPQKVFVHGNAKFDVLPADAGPGPLRSAIGVELNLDGSFPVLVAGSTRGGEEVMLLEAYQGILEAFPETILVIVPRHIERAAEIQKLVRQRGFSCQLRSRLRAEARPRTAPVLVVDTFGELFQIYGAATVVFCGGSLVPLGGQNPLEPAVWEKPVLYGPHMEDFQEAKAILEKAGAGFQVDNPRALAHNALALLKDPAALRACGIRARQAVLGNHGAAKRHAEVIARLATHTPVAPRGSEIETSVPSSSEERNPISPP